MSVIPNSSSMSRQVALSSHPVSSADHQQSRNNPKQARPPSRTNVAGNVSKLVKQFVNISLGKGKSEIGNSDIPGLLYHIPELPKGHSCKSMIDMFQAMTEWAKENPGPGKRPDLTTRTTHELAADKPQYPDRPESYRRLRQPTQLRHRPAHDDDNHGLHEADDRGKVWAHHSIDTSEPNHRGPLTSSEVDPIYSDLVRRPLRQKLHNGAAISTGQTSGTNFWNVDDLREETEHPSSKRSPYHVNDSTDVVPSYGKRIAHELEASDSRVPNRASLRHNSIRDRDDQHVHPISQPATFDRTARNAGVIGSTLPGKARIARLEANAQVVKRRAVRTNQHHNLKNDNKHTVEKSLDLVRFLDPHQPVGPPLTKEEMTGLREPRNSPRHQPHHLYQPYRPGCMKISISNSTPGETTSDKVYLRKGGSAFSGTASSSGAGAIHQLVERSPNLSKLGPKCSLASSVSPPTTPNLPYLAISPAFSSDETLRKWQCSSINEKDKAETTQSKPPTQTATPRITISPPTPVLRQRAQATLYETLYPASSSRPEEYKRAPNTFRKSLSRGTAMRILEVEPGFDFDSASRSTGKFGGILPVKQSVPVDVPYQTGSDLHKRDVTTSQPTLTQTHKKKDVREKVALFEAKSRDVISGEDAVAGNLGGSFAWPRFSDRQYVDPASEYAARWKEIRKARRRGMIFDPKEIEMVIKAGQKG